ncbi:unnamed protein product [Onchocerca flexuosa]|uniref:PDZ domain-containing protein n=1 Tax=Onchocerca flexuosa TaxID=387005 RepID=A0A183H346_9BILA|nr:unnamed protein product [Onchocerca flexuosa]
MLERSEDDDILEDDATTSILVPPPTYRVTVQIDYEEGEPFGIVFGKNLTIIDVKKDMRADGVLYPGDVIISINDVVVEDQTQFYDVNEQLMMSFIIAINR